MCRRRNGYVTKKEKMFETDGIGGYITAESVENDCLSPEFIESKKVIKEMLLKEAMQ